MPRYINPQNVWFYSNEFKIRTAKLRFHPDNNVKDVADWLGIHPMRLSRWAREYRNGTLQNDGKIRFGMSRKTSRPKGTELAALKKGSESFKAGEDPLKKWSRMVISNNTREPLKNPQTKS